MLAQPFLKPHPKENKYQLTRDYNLVVLNTNIVVPRYFMYDGASIPTPAWQFTFSPFHPDVMLPSLVHDWMYYNHQEDRETADDIFYELLRGSDVTHLKATAMWAAVRAGGELFWENDDHDTQMLLNLCERVRHRPGFSGYKFPADIVEQVNAKVVPASRTGTRPR